jgi:disulfide bond formation protein DsbB
VRIDPTAPDQPTLGPPPEGDFNGDGYPDLAVGAPGEDVGSASDAGAVNVIYGSGGGLSSTGNQSFTQDDLGAGETAAGGNRFGAAVAVGDFNHDGFADLAVGAPGENPGSANDAGAVDVLYGSPNGLSASGDQVLSQGAGGIQGGPAAGDRFGAALAAADLNGDGRDDLAVGAPGDSVGSSAGAGAVNVIYGSAGGLSATGNQLWSQESPGIAEAAESGDSLGAALATGDLNGDGRADLAVGAPSETIGTTSAGAVNVLYGSAIGLTAAGNQLWTQDSTDILDGAEAGDSFGAALAAGDLNGDGKQDLAIGVPAENIGTTRPGAGAVNVIYGSAGGLTATGNQLWTQNSTDIKDAAESGDGFGSALATGDLNGDGDGDLAAGVPGESVGTTANAGGVNVILGSGGGLTSTGNQLWTQNSAGVLDSAEAGDSFGAALASGDVNRDGHADMAVGVPGESVGAAAGAGALNMLYGSAGGLTSAANQLWSQDTPNVLGQAEADDQFGAAMGLVAG